ncbi:MAG: radical SAM family heme chaperone HemW [Muribaculaceae bacterium]|nr:radical SAM family heme chaperone HemW [Muribaculaceae bacterium]
MAGIYVHIPFCSAKCSYCDFYSLANHSRMSSYADAVEKEWRARAGELADEPVQTVYFGGGTPSVLPPADILRIASLFPFERVEECTIEVNPEGVNEQAVAAWRKAGVNRVSMGVQSLVDSELQAVGRRHTADDALRAIDCLQRCGIDNISADLIYGLPGQTTLSWQQSLARLLATGIRHLSAYCLSFEEGTRLTMQRNRGLVREASDELIEEMYTILCREAAAAGFEHYEISNFALTGYRSRHNGAYWTGTPYLGLGPGAHSLGADGLRRYVPSELRAYMASPETAVQVDEESATDRLNDLILVSLRTAEGINTELLPDAERTPLLQRATRSLASGALVRDGARLYIPEHRWLTSDAVIRDLFADN